jgi:hypothetical protein
MHSNYFELNISSVGILRIFNEIIENIFTVWCKRLALPTATTKVSRIRLGIFLLRKKELRTLVCQTNLEKKYKFVGQEPLSKVDELSMLLKQAEKPHKESSDFSRTKQEFPLFQKTGMRTENLELLALNFCTKIRSRLTDKSLYSLRSEKNDDDAINK